MARHNLTADERKAGGYVTARRMTAEERKAKMKAVVQARWDRYYEEHPERRKKAPPPKPSTLDLE